MKTQQELEVALAKARIMKSNVETQITKLNKQLDQYKHDNLQTLVLTLYPYVGRCFCNTHFKGEKSYFHIYNIQKLEHEVQVHVHYLKIEEKKDSNRAPELVSFFTMGFSTDQIKDCLGEEISKEDWLSILAQHKLEINGYIQQIEDKVK